MKKRAIAKFEYTLEDRDVRIIKQCLNYCYHRLVKHKEKTGIKSIVTIEEVNELRRELGIKIK